MPELHWVTRAKVMISTDGRDWYECETCHHQFWDMGVPHHCPNCTRLFAGGSGDG